MRIIRAEPPNIDAIDAIFKVRGKPVIFSWDGAIYNPHGIRVTPELLIHEKVHSDRQFGKPEAWWDRYLSDKSFRLDEELHAHRAEFRFLRSRAFKPGKIARELAGVAARLAGPLYGGMVSLDEAKRLILA